MNIARGEHRFGLLGPETSLESAGNSVLAVAQDFGVASAHSKSCLFGLFAFFTQSFEPIKTAVSSFLFIFRAYITLESGLESLRISTSLQASIRAKAPKFQDACAPSRNN
jgi:hypothetical protein